MSALSDNITRYRNEHTMSAAELARRVGISKGYLYSIENGETDNPSVNIIADIARVFGVSVEALIGVEVPLYSETEYELLAYLNERSGAMVWQVLTALQREMVYGWLREDIERIRE